MRNTFYKIAMFAVGLLVYTSCVDDYTDANPPHPLDAPTFVISKAEGDDHVFKTVPVNLYQHTYAETTTYTAPVTYTVSVIDAPGIIGDITASVSVADFGTVALDEASVAAVKGKTTGEFKLTFTPNSDFDELSDRSMNLVITVADTQKNAKGEDSPLVTTMTIPVLLVKCLTQGVDLTGTYVVIEASGNLDNSTDTYTIDDILADAGVDEITVDVTKVRSGEFTFDEITGGVWPTYYSGRANPALSVDLCGTEISGHPGAVTTGVGTTAQRRFIISGTLNEDNTITIEFTYVREVGAPPSIYASGTYTLEKKVL